MAGKKAIIAGASGLIGSNLLQILLDEPFYDEVLIIVRKHLNVDHPKLRQLIVNFDELYKHAAEFTGHAIFLCLGTTAAQTPDKALYRKIDHDYTIQLAQLAHQNNVKQCHLISAVGADATSSNFYLKLKGDTEEDIKKVGISSLHIYRPSMLRGRKENQRFGEGVINGIMTVADHLLIGSFSKYRSISAAQVARRMFIQSTDNQLGTFLYHYKELI
ncbi:NAD-dependent epimerase/dehydratase family protein [Mucilaginibacter myungsuensis]|uniref:NAD-dependent epimerase/dehydratase family protein n=1 Tax=Mucilaginibacter myungsuensis TaxID=649104 RepID=A0A929KV10_9SPHI|nr:NAD(P)H-binding protein [Mucilaginibacter myungsuensis]MBE9661262.1 NAD-dependent epimerase/dehydratase family protein [Mucilaginibacter myungsuensis]MDN3597405.1 NAD-dependent epimerase/dehydratase family protein [Mucilaginibacter myungsuensis]